MQMNFKLRFEYYWRILILAVWYGIAIHTCTRNKIWWLKGTLPPDLIPCHNSSVRRGRVWYILITCWTWLDMVGHGGHGPQVIECVCAAL